MSHPPAVYRRRRVTALTALAVAVAVVVIVITLLTGSDAAERPARTAPRARAGDADAEAKPAELPRGGRRILPDYRVVAYYGAPQDSELGALGIGTRRRRRASSSARPRATRASRAPCCPRWS